MTEQPIVGGDYYDDGDEDGDVKLNEMFNRSAHGPNLIVVNRTATSPPGSPSDGDAYLLAGSCTGDFLGHDYEVAMYYDEGWLFRDLLAGELVTDLATGTNCTVYVVAAVGSPPTLSQIHTC